MVSGGRKQYGRTLTPVCGNDQLDGRGLARLPRGVRGVGDAVEVRDVPATARRAVREGRVAAVLSRKAENGVGLGGASAAYYRA